MQSWLTTIKDWSKCSALGLAILLYSAPTLAEVDGAISKVGDATHMQFTGTQEWKYQVKRIDSNTIKVIVPNISEKTAMSFKAWAGALIEDIKVSKGPDTSKELTIKLANKNAVSFDYLTDEPSRLVIDFFLDSEKVAAEEKQRKKIAASKKVARRLKKAKEQAAIKKSKGYTKKNRSLASTELIRIEKKKKEKESKYPKAGVFDGGDKDFSRFYIKDYEIKEESIIASQQNIYIRFPMLKMKLERLKDLRTNTPEYLINPKASAENKEARFLLKLYENKRYGAFQKTYGYFMKKYPDSIYKEIIMNVYAEVHMNLYQQKKIPYHYQEFTRTYRKLLALYPKSILSERINLLLAYFQLEKREAIETIRSFKAFIEKYPNSDESDNARKALADGFLFLNKPKEAFEVYQSLETSAVKKASAIEASYRMGDVFFEQKDYKKSIEYYLRALKKFPEHGFVFPNAHYNLAESYFWTGEYKESLNNYVEFLKRFPSHEHGGFALTRIGELLDILGADKTRVMGAFLESYFRYRKSPGSEVSRIRLITQRLKGMKEKEAQKALQEMRDIANSSKLPRILEFTNLMVADGLHQRGEYKKSLETLVTYYQRNPTSSNLEFFRRRILRNIADVIKEGVVKKDFLDVLRVHGEYSKTWLRHSDRIDVPFFLANSYEMAGVYKDAETILKGIKKSLVKIKGTRKELERKVNEHLPTLDEVHLRLAAVNLSQRKYIEAYNNLRLVGNDLNDDEKIEKIELQAQVAMHRLEPKKARRYLDQLIEKWEGSPKKLAKTYLLKAQISFQMKDYSDAISSINSLEELEKESGLNEDIIASALELKGNSQLATRNKISAVETYLNLLDRFETKRPLSSVRFKVGKILFENGDIKGAENIWNSLDPEKDPFYTSLAKEQINSAKWQDEYKKYIKRIPAAKR